MIPAPPFWASSILSMWAFHAPYGRSLSPRNGAFVTVTMLFDRETVAFHAQNGSFTTRPSWARVPYLSENAVSFITTRTATSWRRGRAKTFDGSRGPYARSGGATIRFVSPTLIPRTPWSKPLIAAVHFASCCWAGARSAQPMSNEKGWNPE